MTPRKRIIVAITGASGALYAKRLLEALTVAEVYLIISPMGRRLLQDELGIEDITTLLTPNIHLLPYNDVGACIASGSFKTDAMIVIPCSNNKLAELACGLSDNLISRAAQVMLKERRRLILVHRETPLSLIEIQNMLTLTQAGAILCPANPAFYTLPQTIDDLINVVVARLLDLLDIEHNLVPRWTGKSPSE